MASPSGRIFFGSDDEEKTADKRMEKSIVSRDYHVFLRLLKTLRREAKMTQEELGNELGQTQSFVSKVERGERRLDVVETRHFCRAMHVSLNDFIDRLELILNSLHDGLDIEGQEGDDGQNNVEVPGTSS